MAKYGEFKYSDEKYGTLTTGLTWVIRVDWDEDGVYDSVESDYVYDFRSERGREYFVYEDGGGFVRQNVGVAYLYLDNTDGRFDPYNSGSDLYPNVEPGKFISVAVRDESTDTLHDVFTGLIMDIKPVSGEKNVYAVLHDGWQWLKDRGVNIDLKEGATADEIIGDILDAVDWPTLWGRSIGTGSDALDYWWAYNESASKLIQDVVESELGDFWIAADGKAHFTNRRAARTSAMSIDESEMLKGISLPAPWENLRNVCVVTAYAPILESEAVIYQTEEPQFVAYADSYTYTVSFTYNGVPTAVASVTAPAASVDYHANTQSDGSGTDVTLSVSFYVDNAYGTGAAIRVVNNYSGNVYITDFQVKGVPINFGSGTNVDTDNSGSNQPRQLDLDLPWQQNINLATQIAGFLASDLNSADPLPRFQMEDQPAKQFGTDIKDIATLDIGTLSISSTDYRIGYVRHEWMAPTGKAVRSTFHTEPFFDLSEGYWEFPITNFGVDTVFSL